MDKRPILLTLLSSLCVCGAIAAERLDLPGASPWEFDRWQANLAEAANLQDPDELAKSWSQASTEKNELRSLAFRLRLTELDPQRALEFAMRDDRNHLAAQILSDWAVHDPRAALAAWKTHPSIGDLPIGSFLGDGYGDTALECVARTITTRNGSTTEELLAGLEGEAREDFLKIVLEKLAETQPQKALARLGELAEYQADETLAIAGRTLGRTGYHGALKALEDANLQITKYQRRDFVTGSLAGWAEKDPRGALDETARLWREQSGNEPTPEQSVVFEAAVRAAPFDAFEWLATQEKDDRRTVFYNLNRPVEQGRLRFHDIAPAIKRAGLWEEALERIYVSEEEIGTTPADVRLPASPIDANFFPRLNQLADHLKNQSAEEIAELWTQCHSVETELPSYYTVIQSRLILAAITKSNPQQALHRRNCYGVHAVAGYTREQGDASVIGDWFQARPEDVMKLWQAGKINLYAHYDEGGRFSEINAAGIMANEWASTKPEAACRWYVGELLKIPATSKDDNFLSAFRTTTFPATEFAKKSSERAAEFWKQNRPEKLPEGHWLDEAFAPKSR